MTPHMPDHDFNMIFGTALVLGMAIGWTLHVMMGWIR
jgi:hypothetical protein